MPTFTFTYKRRRYVVEAADRAYGYQMVLAQAKELAAKNKAIKAEKMKHTMTCQCCGRAIFAEGGVIAHHGYQRPGDGWQTASCFGARELPFEVSRDVLGKMLDGLKRTLADKRAYRAKVEAEKTPVVLEIEKGRPAWKEKQQYETHNLTRETFPAFKAANPGHCMQRGLWDFDKVKERYIGGLDSTIKFYVSHIKEQQARFDGWKQTHKWDDMWVKL